MEKWSEINMGKDIRRAGYTCRFGFSFTLNTVVEMERNDQCADSRNEEEQNGTAQQIWAS